MSDEKITSIRDHFILKKMHCTLLHSRVPYRTGKKIWYEPEGKYIDEVIWKCKEGCNG